MGKFAIFALAATLFSSAFTDQRSPSKNSNEQSTDTNYASKYTGFDIDAGVGFSGALILLDRTVGGSTYTVQYGNHGVAAQLKIGGTYGFCNYWIAGLEAYGQYNSGDTTHGFPVTGVNHRFKFELPWNVGFDARLGFVYWPSNMIYIYGGPDWGYFDFKYTNEAGFKNTFKEFEIGGRVGAGVEQKICPSWIMKTTFDYAWYPKKTYSHGDILGANHKHDIRVRLATFLFSVGYLF